jgi:hypothetical protein
VERTGQRPVQRLPRDWIEGAGWRRLNLLNRAFGESAHGSTQANRNIARDAPVAIQDADDQAAQYMGRTHTLTAMIFILSVGCAARVDTFGSHLGDAYHRVIRIDEAHADKAIAPDACTVTTKTGIKSGSNKS